MSSRATKLTYLHPMAFAVWPVVFLLSWNVSEIDTTDSFRSLTVAAAIAAALTLVYAMLYRELRAAALAASGTLLALGSYGHLYRALGNVVVAGETVGRHRYLLPLTGLLLLSWLLWLWRRRGPGLDRTMTAWAVMGTILLVVPLQEVVRYNLVPAPAVSAYLAALPELGRAAQTPVEPPRDIVYLILDAYGGDDVLAEQYGHSNTGFLQDLAARGFDVAGRSRSNYSQTLLSLASSLNLQYLQPVVAEMGPSSTNRQPLKEMIRHSLARSFLEQRGYQFVAFQTGYVETNIRDADVYWIPETEYETLRSLNAFEGQLLESSLAVAALDLQVQTARTLGQEALAGAYEVHRNRIEGILAKLGDMVALPGPQFVFAHVLIPHPPFVFGPNGEARPQSSPFTLGDATAFTGQTEAYIEGYRDQVRYANVALLRALDDILARADTDPIILVQGDHGPAAHIVWDSAELTDVRERHSILNAYRLPGVPDGTVPESITPVNTFRLIFRLYFGIDLPALEDKAYYSIWDRPYDFVDVTSRVWP